MTAVPEQRKASDTWGACALAWLIAWLLASALLVVLLLLVLATNAIRFHGTTDLIGSMDAFEAMLATLIAAIHGVGIAVALLVALPLQATALRLRRAGEGSETLAGVAALTSLSAVLSFLVLYAVNRPLLLLTTPSAELLALVLVAVYIVHVGILLLARRRMRRMDARTRGRR